MLHLHTSNRLEALAGALAEVLRRDPPADPFEEVVVTVAHPGMGRWLELRLAEHLGVVLRHAWPLPGRTAWRLLRAAAEGEALPEEDPLDPRRLALRIWEGLRRGELAPPPELAVGEDPRGLRGWRLAVALAEAFEQLVLYRPDWVRAWEAGGPGFDDRPELRARFGWQAAFWRRLAAGRPHRLRLAARLLDRLRQGRPPAALPSRLLLFGLSHLPPLYLDLFLACARHLEVHLFLVQPSRQYWGDAPGRREARRRLLEDDPEGAVHPLLAQWGREARELTDALYDRLDGLPYQEHPCFEEPAGDGNLQRLQRSLLELEAVEAGPPDETLVVHASHGPLRACQEAVAAILEARRRDPGLQPREIAILAVDLEAYAPYLEAAFEALPPEARLPYAIVDRRGAGGAPLLALALELLRLPEREVTAPWLRGLLEEPALRRRFRIGEDQLPALEDWLRGQRVRRGLGPDGPAGAEPHSLAGGEARTLAGYALPEDPFRLFEAIAPAPGVEGELAEALGGLLELGERLRRWRARLAAPRTLAAWCRETAELLADLLSPSGEELEQLRPLHEALEGLEDDARELGLGLPLEPALFRAVLEGRLDMPRITEGYLAGGVTCCALHPLRHLPFRHVHVLGLQQEAFPRPDRRPALDPLTAHRRRGDRSPPDDDRLALLETLLAAREALHLHYQHRDPRDDSRKEPSSVIVELLEQLHGGQLHGEQLHREGQAHPGGEAFEEVERSPFVRRHPMQPFSPARFAGERPAPDPLWARAARGLAGERRPTPLLAPLLSRAGPPPEAPEEPAGRVLELADLEAFLAAPLGWFFRRGLGLPREEELPPLEEHEPFALNHLEGYALRERLWEAFRRGEAVAGEALRARLEAEGLLPPGAAGEQAWREEAGAWGRLRRRLDRWWGEPLPPWRLDLELTPAQEGEPPLRLQGWVEGLRRLPEEEAPLLLQVRPGRRRAGHLLRLWAASLAACAAGAAPRQARLVALDGDHVLRPLPPGEARRDLAILAALAWEGMRRPLPLLPEAVETWAREPGRLHPPYERPGRPRYAELPALERIWGPVGDLREVEGLEALTETVAGLLARSWPSPGEREGAGRA